MTPPKTKLDRIDRTIAGLPKAVYEPVADLAVEAWVTREPVAYADRKQGEHKAIKVGETWGELWDCAWFHLSGQIPDDAKNKSLVLLIDFNGEGLVVDAKGNPRQGLTAISSEFDYSLGRPGKRVVPWQGSNNVDLWIDVGLNDLFGRLPNGGRLEEARIAIRRENLQSLCFDFEVLRELLNQLPNQKARYATILQALYDAAVLLATGLTDDAVNAAAQRLKEELDKQGGTPSLTISALGHAHIDLAWLWPLRETIRKGARTFSTVLRMMERYPDYKFGASQPQLYQWMKDHYPSLYKEIKKRVKEGRWEVQGAMWVEPDCNIPSGESLVRQILYGKQFFLDEFGKDVTNLWEPDVFGYSGSIPQILRKAGIDTFMTQKLSWSTFNKHPHHTFHWEGIDGSSVLVHMPPEATYNSSAAPRAIARAENDYLDKEVSGNCLLLFGIGDGGGGPGEEHLERLAREKNLDGLAPVVQEFSEVFFDRLKMDSDKYARWRGELYLERHQGTFTSQARNKRFNRKIELSLRDAELACVRAMLAGHEYPSAALERIWKEVLLLQFHDILPGSSITRVFDESRARYAAMLAEVEELIDAADHALLGSGSNSAVVNSLSWPRKEWIKVDGSWRLVEVDSFAICPLPDPSESLGSVSATPELLDNCILRVRFDAIGNIESIFSTDIGREILRRDSPANVLAVYEDRGDAWDFPFDYDAPGHTVFELVSTEAFVDGPKGVIRQVRKYGNSTLTQEISVVEGSRRIDFKTTVDWQERNKMLRTNFPVAVHADRAKCEIQFGHIDRPTHGNTSWDWAQDEVCAQKWIDLSEPGYGVALLNDCKYGHRIKDGILDLNLLRSPSYPDPAADEGEHEFTYSLLPHSGDHVSGHVVQAAYELNVPLRLVEGVETTDAPSLIRIGDSCSQQEVAGECIVPPSGHPEAATGPTPEGSRKLARWSKTPGKDDALESDPEGVAESQGVIVETIKKAESNDDVIVRLYEAHGRSTWTRLRPGFPVTAVRSVDLMEGNGQYFFPSPDPYEIGLNPFEIETLRLVRG